MRNGSAHHFNGHNGGGGANTALNNSISMRKSHFNTNGHAHKLLNDTEVDDSHSSFDERFKEHER